RRQIEEYRNAPDYYSGAEKNRLAYLSLEAPQYEQDNQGTPALTWSIFERRINDPRYQILPDTFINARLSFEAIERSSVHREIDKGGLFNEVKRIFNASNIDSINRQFLDFIKAIPKPMRATLRAYVINYFSLASDIDFSRAYDVQSIINSQFDTRNDLSQRFYREILSLLLPYYHQVSSARELIENIAYHLSYYEPAMERFRPRIESFYSKILLEEGISSRRLLEALDAVLFFHQHAVSRMDSDFGIRISHLENRLAWFLRQRNLVNFETGNVTSLEIEFSSKRPEDQFFGYIAEDCTKDRGHEILNPNFQVGRIFRRGRWDGVINALKSERTNPDDKQTERALIISLGLQDRLNVEAKDILTGLEQHLTSVLQEEGYDYLLISTDIYQQGNRADVQDMLVGRSLNKISWDVENSSIFKPGEYYILWKRSLSNSSTF
ncbi:MAG: hypothetical protein JNK65_08985, partial [Deltaproteobacteria bacterium]|nr:hypothetical protein [Deltaproteobacteria bacterium]